MENLENQSPQSQNPEETTTVSENSFFQPAPDLNSEPPRFAMDENACPEAEAMREPVPEAAVEEPENWAQTQYDTAADNGYPAQMPDWPSGWQADEAAADTLAEGSYAYVPGETQPYGEGEVPAPASKPGKNTARKLLKAAAWVVIIALAVGIGCLMTARRLNAYWGNRVEEMQYAFGRDISALQQQVQELEGKSNLVIGSNIAPGEALSPAQVYALNVRSVVMIRSSNRMSYATGSGFILSSDGYVVTNHHVIEGGTEFTVIISDGTEYAAELVGSDNTNDVALLKVDAQGLPAVILGNSADLVVGDQVAAIGNPLGELTSTLTVGYVSAMERDVNTEGFAINMLQTDAAINSGNSGGPLFNMRGEVVGITTAKYSGTSSSGATIEGVGFAIPIDDVKGLLSDLVSYGYVTGAFMGVRVSDMDPEAASYYGLPVGAYVQDTEPDGPARLAGIVSKDIIVKVGDYDVRTVNDLTRALRNYKAGDTVTVVIYRGGGEMKVLVTLTDKPAN